MVLHVLAFDGLLRLSVLDDQLHVFGSVVRFFGNDIFGLVIVFGRNSRLCDVVFGVNEDVLFATRVIVGVDDDKGRILGVGSGRRQVGAVDFFLVVDEVGVDVLAVVGHVILISLKLFPDALFGKYGSLLAGLFFLSLAPLLEVVKREVELVDDEDQEQEGEDDDDTGFADVSGQYVVEPQTDGASEDGTFRRHGGNESEKQRHPHQAEKCPFPNAPHLDLDSIYEAQSDEGQQVNEEERTNAERFLDEGLPQEYA